ncbi:MAG: FHA domain-containing protein [Chloroflexi bacterium]|nr:FHA domain-containing protein [Chloroflexota bacterium]
MQTIRSGIPSKGVIRIEVHNQAHKRIEVEISGSEGYIIGRSDNKSSYLPDIDLADFQALEMGVSRRHAALVHYRQQLHLLDLSSVNGTFLNGERLSPEVPYPLSHDDKILLGNLSLLISYLER